MEIGLNLIFGETSFAILQRPAHKGDVVANKTRIMFEIDDIELIYEELKNKGVKTIGEIRTEPYGKLLTFEGNSPKTGVLCRFIIVVIFAVGSCSVIR